MMSLFAVGTRSVHDEINRQLEASLDGLDDDYTNERDIARQQQDVLKMVMEHSETGKNLIFYLTLSLVNDLDGKM